MTTQYINNISDGTNTYTIQDPNALTNEDVTSTYDSSGTSPVNGTAIASAINGIGINNRDGSALPLWVGSQIQWEQGENTPWYYWQTSPTGLCTIYQQELTNSNFLAMCYFNNKFIGVIYSYIYSSDDGKNWTQSYYNYSFTYGLNTLCLFKDKICAIGNNSIYLIYSSDGENWNNVDLTNYLTSSANTRSKYISQCNDYLVIVSSQMLIYSSDLTNWTTVDVSSMMDIYNDIQVIYGNDIYLFFNKTKKKIWYSSDLRNWTESTSFGSMFKGYPTWQMSTDKGQQSLCFGKNKFIVADYSNKKIVYSSDGIMWNNYSASFLKEQLSSMYFHNDVFFISPGSTPSTSTYGTGYYSTDGLNWTSITMPIVGKLGNAKIFIKDNDILFNANDYILKFSISSTSCFTDTINPTTSSTVYSAPDTISALTVSSVTSGAITLSDNNTYYYNAIGNTSTYRTVGEVHPDYLCFITNVGVKIGNTNITPVITTSITSSSTDTEVPSAKAVYDEIGTVETQLSQI